MRDMNIDFFLLGIACVVLVFGLISLGGLIQESIVENSCDSFGQFQSGDMIYLCKKENISTEENK